MRVVDTHAHLDGPRFRGDLADVLDRARNAGVTAIINVGFDLASSRQSVRLAGRTPMVKAAVGVHPHDAAKVKLTDWDALIRLLADPAVVAVGEMGLDYYRDLSPRPVQREVFARQLSLARDADLPVIVHDRDAHADILDVLGREGRGLPGVLHCFSGDWGVARRALDMGFYLGLAGPLTYPGSHALRDVAQKAPLDRLLVETDCPYLAPQSRRGDRNEPALVVDVLRRLADMRGMPVNDVAGATTANAHELFPLLGL